MTSSLPSRLGFGLMLALGTASRAAAQVTTFVANVGYQSPALVAPAVFLSSSAASGARVWTVGIAGFTLSADLTKRTSPTVAMVLRAEATPVNANSSRYVYRDGRRDPALGFRDRTVRLSAGLRVQGSARWRMDVRVIGLYESVAGVADSTVVARWRAPYVGLGIETNYSRVVSDDVFNARWDGFKAAGSAAGFLGSQPWWKSQLSFGWGRQVGRVNLRGRAWFLLGHNLDVVNQHLVGGCWDLTESPPLYGYHYAEFRVDRGGVLAGGVDLRLAGDWELGLRVGYLTSPARSTYGEAVRLSTIWSGIRLHFGVGLPAASLFRGGAEAPLVFAGVSAGVF
ncbi:MAG: hypothetical protein HW416_2131 [Chloroflexi bacterium]|nr:hypothetical protein [Chloroflexota bacterium]